MNNKGVKSSPGWLIAVIAAGVADVILLVLLIAAFVLPKFGGADITADVPKDFTANADTYTDIEYDSEYSSDASVNFSGGSLKESSGGSETTDDEDGMYSGFVFPDSDKVLLTDDRISEIVTDADTCRRAINEIYARHGYEFTMQANIDFFNQYDWYKNMDKESDMEKVSAQFSKTEKSNVDKLLEFEDANGWN